MASLCLLAALPAAAGAATVATRGDLALKATSKAGAICLKFGRTGDCLGRPTTPFDVALVQADSGDAAGIAVSDDVAAVGVVGAKGESEHVPTTTAAGFDERFAIVPGIEGYRYLRFYDDQGTLIGSAAEQSAARPEGHRVVVGPPGARITVLRLAQLYPDPVDVDRVVHGACISPAGGSSTVCIGEPEPDAMVLNTTSGCRRPPRLYGIAGRSVRRVRLTLGTGRHMTVRTQPLPAAYSGARVVAASTPRHLAIRSAAALDAGGHVVARRAIGAGPKGDCLGHAEAEASVPDFGSVRPDARPQPVVAAAGHRLSVGEHDRALCLQYDARRPTCVSPPVTVEPNYQGDFAPANVELLRHGSIIAGVVPATVTGFALRTRRGPQHIDTIEGEYTGRYADTVRFVLARVPGAITRATARDADGRDLGQAYVFRDGPPSRRIGTTGLKLVHYSDTDAKTYFQGCAAPVDAKPFTNATACADIDQQVIAEVPCGARGPLVFGVLDKRGPVSVQLADGRRISAGIRQMRALHSQGVSGAPFLWSARLPRGTAVTGVAYGTTTAPLHLPPQTRQCGYVARSAF